MQMRFGADRMIVRLQQLGRRAILDNLRDLFADETRRRCRWRPCRARGCCRHDMKVRPPRLQRASYFGAALVVAVVERAAIGHFGIDAVARLFARKAPDFGYLARNACRSSFAQQRIAGAESRNSRCAETP